MKTIKTKEEIQDYLRDSESNKTIMLVHASWCVPCKSLFPQFCDIEKEYTNINFYDMDVDVDPQICNEWKVMSVPTVRIMHNGNLVVSLSNTTIDVIKEMLDMV